MTSSLRVVRSAWLVGTAILASGWGLPTGAFDAAKRARGAEEPADARAQPDEEPASSAADLPWNRSAVGALEPPTERLSSAREMLDLFNVDASELEQLLDGRPLVADEEETLWKILYNMPRFGLDKLHAWRRAGIAWDEVANHPEQYRIEVFGLEGRAHGVRRVELPRESAERLELTHFYQVDFILNDAANPVVVCCREVPEAWQTQAQLDERAACLGLFLKSGPADPQPVPMFFAAERIAWMPDRVEPQLGVDAEDVFLGELGVDVGLVEGVRQTNGRSILSSDRELFYQMLAATRRVSPDAAFQRAASQFELARLLNDPASLQGRLLSFYATAVRVQKILVDDQDIRQRFGIDHYYQIDLQVPLGDQEVRLVTKPGETDGPVFRNVYPAHCNVLELPIGLPDEPDVNEQIHVAGFYFKLWAYRTEYVKSFGKEKRQLGPLFLAVTPRVVERSRATNPLWGWIGGGIFLAAIAGMALASWLYRRSDARFHEVMRRRQTELDAGESLDQLSSQVQEGPDFSRLEQDSSS